MEIMIEMPNGTVLVHVYTENCTPNEEREWIKITNDEEVVASYKIDRVIWIRKKVDEDVQTGIKAGAVV